jgi:hypothetical protein
MWRLPAIILVALTLGLVSLVTAAIFTNAVLVFVVFVLFMAALYTMANMGKKISRLEYALDGIAAVFATIIVVTIGQSISGLFGSFAGEPLGVMLELFFALLAATALAAGIVLGALKIQK